jgi:hypothetical protein
MAGEIGEMYSDKYRLEGAPVGCHQDPSRHRKKHRLKSEASSAVMPRPMPATGLRVHLAALIGYSCVALVFAWPLPARLGVSFPGDPGGDIGVYVWNLWVFRHELLTRPGRSSAMCQSSARHGCQRE